MEPNENLWKHLLIRVVIISGIGILVGYVLYRKAVFMPSMVPFQFVESSITAGLAYAFLKKSTYRNMAAALCGWYFIALLTFADINPWLPILYGAYILGITAAILIDDYIITKLGATNPFVRIIFAGAIISVMNGVIIVALRLVSWQFSHFEWSFKNMEYGAIIGLAVGIGIELAEYADRKMAEFNENYA